MKKLKMNAGITLVALIITIIVLLILAVVSIRAITGGEGIFTKTENATQRYEEEKLREENIDITGYWYNPNIHPYMEYKSRRDCLKEYTNSINVKAIFEEEYGLDEFCKNVISDLDNRCTNYCYIKRLEKMFSNFL